MRFCRCYETSRSVSSRLAAQDTPHRPTPGNLTPTTPPSPHSSREQREKRQLDSQRLRSYLAELPERSRRLVASLSPLSLPWLADFFRATLLQVRSSADTLRSI